jgi:hypothetical protein
MGKFLIEKQAEAEPVYCDYIQEKVNIARKNGAIYSLDDEDNRIQELYNQEGLETKDKIKVINRVRSNDDGKEYIVVNKNVDFFKNGVYKDRYSTREGIVELPLKTTNPDTGATETKQNQLVYTTLFTGSKVDEYLKKADGQGSIPQLVFYEGSTTSNRLPITLPAVANSEFFKEASWTELQVGREKKVLNSLMNRLPEVRKELKGSSGSTAEPTEIIQRQEISPSDKQQQQQQEPKEEVNKVEPTKENIVEVKSSSSSGGQTGAGNKSINQPSKKN